MINPSANGEYYELHDPISMPNACGFLWNEVMMIQPNCRGYATSQYVVKTFMKYSHPMSVEGKVMMLPELPYYTHHPARFVFIKDETTGTKFSAPYEPMRVKLDKFLFKAGQSDVIWEVEKDQIAAEVKVTLPRNDFFEFWSVTVENKSSETKKISVYPYATVGYMSWMNMGAEYDEEIGGVLASAVSAYQISADWEKVKHYKDMTYLISEEKPVAYCANQAAFEGEGGLWNPSALDGETLNNNDARYEVPLASVQYRVELQPGEKKTYRLIFGAANNKAEIMEVKNKYFNAACAEDPIEKEHEAYAAYIAAGHGAIEINTPDKGFDNFVNIWLPRQLYYAGISNRLVTDPQTRNLVQDNMGMVYVNPEMAKSKFRFVFEQQKFDGTVPDGIKLIPDAVFNFINNVPHSDHGVWMTFALDVLLSEAKDYSFLDEEIPYIDNDTKETVYVHVLKALKKLAADCDARGLNYIRQGDWNDPMNMVGLRGIGVSAWLTEAASYAYGVWAKISDKVGKTEEAKELRELQAYTNEKINEYFWDKEWYARGITDDGVTFGVSTDPEGKIFLNTQSFGMLSGAPSEEQKKLIKESVKRELETPYGLELFAPAYRGMREDVGRVTQKYPGNAENGAVYCHAAAFYIYSLYQEADSNDDAFRMLRELIPGDSEEDQLRRGQLPIYMPNYYRGAYEWYPEWSGRSSHLFNTGSTPWYYRSIIEGLFGLKGCDEGLMVAPKLPSTWDQVSVKRLFRGAEINIEITRGENKGICVNGAPIEGNVVTGIEAGKTYDVKVVL